MTRQEILDALLAERYAGPIPEWTGPIGDNREPAELRLVREEETG